MAINKVIYGNNTLIDITDTTATADKILSGYTAYGADGVKVIGTASSGGGGAISTEDIPNATGTTLQITGESKVIEALSVTENGIYTAPSGVDGYSPVTVNVEGGLNPDIDDYLDTDITGMNVVYQGSNLEFTGAVGSYIDTEVMLFSESNINKDFKIIMRGVYFDNNVGTDSKNHRCLLGAMYEVSPYPGFIIRGSATGAGVFGLHPLYEYAGVIIDRTNGGISISCCVYQNEVLSGALVDSGATKSINNPLQPYLQIGSMANCTTSHNTPLTLGCELQSDGTPFRYTGGRIASIVVAMSD